MASDNDSPKREATPTTSLSSIPQKRAFDEVHSPAVPSPLNPESRPVESIQSSQVAEDGITQSARSKPTRVKKDSVKKREAKGGDSIPPTPDPKGSREPEQSESSPLRYKLAPPKLSDFDPPRGPVLTLHHDVELDAAGGVDKTEFFEISDQYVRFVTSLDSIFPMTHLLTYVFWGIIVSSTKRTFDIHIALPILYSQA